MSGAAARPSRRWRSERWRRRPRGPVRAPPPAPRPADSESSAGLGGWTISASAAPVTWIYDPKIPIPAQPGKPNLEFDISYTRASYGSGPTGAATASFLWPGDAIAFGLGQLFNSPNVKYPILTNVQYPGSSPDATMQPVPGSYMQSHTDTNGLDVGVDVRLAVAGDRALAAGVFADLGAVVPAASGGLLGGLLGGVLPQPQLPDLGTLIQFLTGQAALVDVQGERSQSSATVTGGPCRRHRGVGRREAADPRRAHRVRRSEGHLAEHVGRGKGTSAGNVDYGSMSVAGVNFGITANGIQTPFGVVALPQLPNTINPLLAPLGISVALPAAGDMSKDTAGEMFSHGLQITIDTAKLKAMLPLTPVLNQLFAQIPPSLTSGLPAPLPSLIQTLPQLAPKIVLTVGSATSKADASPNIDVGRAASAAGRRRAGRGRRAARPGRRAEPAALT